MNREMKSFGIPFLFLFLLAGCASSSQGIKIRAVSPPVAEAFRKLSLAATVDGYEIKSVDRFSLETNWRELKDNEKQNNENENVKLEIRLDQRGRLYDVRIIPFLQTTTGSIATVTDIHHPLITKWKRILHSIVEKDSRDED